MIYATYLNYLYSSILFYIFCKIVCSVARWRRISMHYKHSTTLSSIPEKSEIEEDTKWVPKKKHEMLKAKYKCLKKLFQIYDASVIGILPETYAGGDIVEDTDDHSKKTRKRKRSHRVRADACAGTSDHSIQGARDLQTSSKTDTSESDSCPKVESKTKVIAATQASRESLCASDHECACAQTNVMYPQVPNRSRMSRERKRTRFQCFMQRLLGLRDPNPHRGGALGDHVLALSDNEINHRSVERRRRRRLRFRRLRRPTRVQSESAMRPPALLDCAHAVQRYCLLDTTPRQCPVVGCRMMLYGIINYNDHLNMCHFCERRYICHYCHEGFEREADKLQHENEHVGLGHLTTLTPAPSPLTTSRSKTGITSVTQTEPEVSKDIQGEKLKKIVSFFDKIVDSRQLIADVKKSRHSEMNLRTSKTQTDTQTDTCSDGDSKHVSSCSDVTGKRLTCSCNDLRRGGNHRSLGSDVSSRCCAPKCNFCEETFDYSVPYPDRKLGFRSCGALPSRRRAPRPRTEDGAINVTSVASSVIGLAECTSSITQSSVTECGAYTGSSSDPSRKPSTSIVFSASECSGKFSNRSLADRFKSYKWEPCTRIIRV